MDDEIETDRLVMRPWRATDAADFVRIFTQPPVMRFSTRGTLSEGEALSLLGSLVEHWEVQGFGMWAVVAKGTGATLGTIGLAVPGWLPEILPAVEIGWRIDPAHWGHGYAGEGARGALDFAFDRLGLDRVVSIAQPGNPRSWRVMQRLGMRLASRTVHPQRPVPLVVYEIEREAWTSSKATDWVLGHDT